MISCWSVLTSIIAYYRERCQINYNQARAPCVYYSIAISSLSLERIICRVGEFPKSGGIRLVTNRACANRLDYLLRVDGGIHI